MVLLLLQFEHRELLCCISYFHRIGSECKQKKEGHALHTEAHIQSPPRTTGIEKEKEIKKKGK
jgi:hypothetical protein